MNPKGNGGKLALEAAGIGLLALFLQLVHLQQQTQNPLFEVPVAEARTFVELTRELLSQGSLPPNAPPSLYPFFLGGIFWLCGEAYGAARFVQALLGAVNCVLLWRLGYALFSSRPIALGTGLAAALYGPLLFFGGALLPPVLAVFFALLSLHALLWAMAEESVWRFGVSGLLLGLAALSGAHVLLFALGVLLWLWLPERRGLGAGAGLVLGMAVVLLPVFLWSGGAGAMLYPSFGLAAQNLYPFWQGQEFLPDLDPYYGREFSGLLAALMWKGWIGFPFGLVAPLAVVGLGFRLRSPERSRAETSILLFVVTCSVETLFFECTSGTRVVLVPGFLLFAAVGVGEWKRSSWPQRGASAVILVLLGVGLNLGQMGKTAQPLQHHWLGYAYEQLDMRVNAVREYEKAISLGIERMDTYLALAGLYSAGEEYDRAIGVYRGLLQRWPGESAVRLALGDHYAKAGLAAEAATAYRALLREGGDSAVLLPRLAQAHLGSQDAPSAIEAYRELLKIQPENNRVRFQLGMLYTKEGRIQEAQAAYRPLLQDATWVAAAGPRLADLLMRTRQEAEAEQVLIQTLTTAPDSAPALALLGKLLYDQGRPEESLLYFERLRPLQSEDFRVYFYLTKLYRELGREREAEEAMDLYLEYRRQKHRADIQRHAQEESALLLKNILGEIH